MKVRILQWFHTPGLPAFEPGQVRELDQATAYIFIKRQLVEAVEKKTLKKAK